MQIPKGAGTKTIWAPFLISQYLVQCAQCYISNEKINEFKNVHLAPEVGLDQWF
jgi:hypothetical protein